MSAAVTIRCDRPIPGTGGDLCCSLVIFGLTDVDVDGARRLAAADGWTATEDGDTCPSCSRTRPRPSLRGRLG